MCRVLPFSLTASTYKGKLVYEYTANWDKHLNRKVPLIPNEGVPLQVLDGSLTYDCSYGPERNRWNKNKVAAMREQRLQVCIDLI